MKKPLSIVFIILIWAVGFSESLPLNTLGISFRRDDLNIKWNVQSNNLPFQIWAYKSLPNQFSRDAVTNLERMLEFKESQKTYDGSNGVVFDSPKDSRRLAFYFPLGWIKYSSKEIAYDPSSHLATGETSEKEIKPIMLHLLSQLGFNLADVEKNEANAEPYFRYRFGESTYYVSNVFITNLYEREVAFKRIVDGYSWVGARNGGEGTITFGEHGKITKMDVYWRKLERFKAYDVPTLEQINKMIRNGKAVQNSIRMNEEPINWKTVKSLAIKKAIVCYLGGKISEPANTLFPLVALWTTVDRGERTIDVEIDCPFQDAP